MALVQDDQAVAVLAALRLVRIPVAQLSGVICCAALAQWLELQKRARYRSYLLPGLEAMQTRAQMTVRNDAQGCLACHGSCATKR